MAALALLGTTGCERRSPVQVFINEVLPANDKNCADEDGERNDWVELYNAEDDEVDLRGFSLTDDTATPDKHVFGDGVTIPAGSVLLLWADSTVGGKGVHMSFKFSAFGEAVALYDPEGRLVDVVRWTNAASDVSFARFPDGTGAVVPCDNPTCGRKNGSSCQ